MQPRATTGAAYRMTQARDTLDIGIRLDLDIALAGTTFVS